MIRLIGGCVSTENIHSIATEYTYNDSECIFVIVIIHRYGKLFPETRFEYRNDRNYNTDMKKLLDIVAPK